MNVDVVAQLIRRRRVSASAAGTSELADEKVRVIPAMARPYLLGALASLSAAASAIHSVLATPERTKPMAV